MSRSDIKVAIQVFGVYTRMKDTQGMARDGGPMNGEIQSKIVSVTTELVTANAEHFTLADF